MELAKITAKGQITLPISIRRELNLKDGDKVAFIEKDGNYILVNPISLAVDKIRDDFKGEAKKLGLETEDDVVNMVKDIRKNKSMLEDIIKRNEKRIEKDINQIRDIQKIDFIDIFPESEEHRKMLDEECSKISKLIDSTEKGNFYLLNKPIKTKWGNLKFLKIRFFDKSRIEYEAAPDFVVKDWNKIKEQVGKDKRFSYISRPNWEAVEFKTENSLVYFLNPLVTSVYGIK